MVNLIAFFILTVVARFFAHHRCRWEPIWGFPASIMLGLQIRNSPKPSEKVGRGFPPPQKKSEELPRSSPRSINEKATVGPVVGARDPTKSPHKKFWSYRLDVLVPGFRGLNFHEGALGVYEELAKAVRVGLLTTPSDKYELSSSTEGLSSRRREFDQHINSLPELIEIRIIAYERLRGLNHIRRSFFLEKTCSFSAIDNHGTPHNASAECRDIISTTTNNNNNDTFSEDAMSKVDVSSSSQGAQRWRERFLGYEVSLARNYGKDAAAFYHYAQHFYDDLADDLLLLHADQGTQLHSHLPTVVKRTLHYLRTRPNRMVTLTTSPGDPEGEYACNWFGFPNYPAYHREPYPDVEMEIKKIYELFKISNSTIRNPRDCGASCCPQFILPSARSRLRLYEKEFYKEMYRLVTRYADLPKFSNKAQKWEHAVTRSGYEYVVYPLFGDPEVCFTEENNRARPLRPLGQSNREERIVPEESESRTNLRKSSESGSPQSDSTNDVHNLTSKYDKKKSSQDNTRPLLLNNDNSRDDEETAEMPVENRRWFQDEWTRFQNAFKDESKFNRVPCRKFSNWFQWYVKAHQRERSRALENAWTKFEKF